MSAEQSSLKYIAPPCTRIHAQPSTRQLLHGHSNCSSIQHFMYGVFRSSVMIDITHVSSRTATQDTHGHTPRHCWHATHRLGSTEHPPFACSRTTHSSQPPQSTIRSAYTTPHQRATLCENGKALKRKHISLSCKPTAHPRRPPHSIYKL